MPDALLIRQVWDQACRHIDGFAIGSTVCALADAGALDLIARSDVTNVADLGSALRANRGYLNVAIRLLADQGWVSLDGSLAADDAAIRLTPIGRIVLTQLADHYRVAGNAVMLTEGFTGFVGLMRREWDLPPSMAPVRARLQVLSHLDGHLVTPVMSALARLETQDPDHLLPAFSARYGEELAQAAVAILAHQGWLAAGSDTPGEAEFTPAGRIAIECARQYWYPVTYLATLRKVPELIFGELCAPWVAALGDTEQHLDRDLDLRFSGAVFSSLCVEPFLEAALPLFDRQPVEAQPTIVIDAGCGDGSLLESLHQAIVTRTYRGTRLADRPLLMVGMEPSAVGRSATSKRLEDAGADYLVIPGDIADPAGLARSLREEGLDIANALHISKSVVHDRDYRAPSQRAIRTDPPANPPPLSSGAFVAADGAAIDPADMALSLADFFRAWRPFTAGHGMFVIEAHSIAPAKAAALMGRTLATAFDATHGYSCQYPVEEEVFTWALADAGYRSVCHRSIGAEMLGHTLLTIDHLVPTGLPS